MAIEKDYIFLARYVASETELILEGQSDKVSEEDLREWNKQVGYEAIQFTFKYKDHPKSEEYLERVSRLLREKRKSLKERL
jgi:hypothetical protein